MIDKVLLDLDGVCVDFLGGAIALHGKSYPNYPPHNPDTQDEQTPWNIEPIFEMSANKLWAPMGREFWANLKPLPHFKALITALEAKFGEQNICLLTTPPLTAGAIEGKMDWIREYLPAYRRRFLVGPAKEFCASERHVLIDDHEANVEKFKDAGGQTFLFPAPWNRRFKEHAMPALKEWLETV